MKLNKPPVSEEQSALEEYVDFLLTDLSNVTPLRSHNAKNISEVIAEHPSLRNPSAEIEEKPVSPVKIDAKKKSTETIKQENNVEKIFDEPGWSTIEKACEGTTENDLISDIDGLPPQDVQSEIVPRQLPADKKDVSGKSNPVKPQQRPFFEAESEEDELRKWNALLAKEKEQQNLTRKTVSEEKLEDSAALLSKSIKDTAACTKNKRVPDEPTFQFDAPKPVEERPIIHPEDFSPSIAEPLLPEQPDARLADVEKLLARISVASKPASPSGEKTSTLRMPQQSVDTPQEGNDVADNLDISSETVQATFLHRETQKCREVLPEVFQTLIFEVGKLPLAVPLLKLGGIVKVSKQDITPLVGTPKWFMGLVPNDRGNLMVVDTQQFLMPERSIGEDNIGENSCENSGYEYLIVLDNSNWALACHSVGDAKNLTQDDVRWSEKSSARPWFSGMVVDYMSALIEVDELINMLADNIAE